MHPLLNDTAVAWTTRPVDLVHRFLVLADELEALGNHAGAGLIRDVLNNEYNPLLGGDSELGDPPTATTPPLRPAVPSMIRLRTGPHEASLRRARDPGEDPDGL